MSNSITLATLDYAIGFAAALFFDKRNLEHHQ
jgi:hypothetical protein